MSFAQDYHLTVAGKEVTSANKGDIMGDGKVSYDPATHTLKLKNANIETGFAGIFTEDRLIIDLEGNNSIRAPRGVESCYNPTSAGDYAITICSSSGGSLSTEGYESAFSVANSGGIYVRDCSITTKQSMSAFYGYISGNNTTLKIEHANIDIQGQSTEACIAGFESLVLEKCDIVEPTNAYFKSAWGYGAMRQGDDDTKCISLKIKAKEATDYGISVSTLGGEVVSVNSENYTNVLGDGTLSYNPETNVLKMNDVHLFGFAVLDICKKDLRIEVSGTQNSIEGFCMINTSCTLVGSNTKKSVTSQLNVNSLAWSSSLTIQDLAVEFIGGKQGLQTQSGTASLTLRNATVNANGAEGVFKSIPSLVLEDCEILTPEGAYYDAEKKYIVDESGNRVTGVVTIGPKVEPVVDYGIAICASEFDWLDITSENYADVLGDGTLSYDPVENVLYLNNLQTPDKYILIGHNILFNIEAMAAANKDLAGIKVIVTGDNALRSIQFMGGVNGTICGDGNLLLRNLPSFDNLLIEDCNLVLKSETFGIHLYLFIKAPGKLTIRNANVKIESDESCITGLSELVLDGCYIYSPAGAHYDKEKHAILDKDGKEVTGNLIIRKGAPQFPGSGTKDDPYILSEGTNTFTTPVGETYYKYKATEDCVMQIEVKEESGVTGDIYVQGLYNDREKLESCEKLVWERLTMILRIVSTDPDNEVTVKIREIREGETREKAILLNEGDNPIPAIDRKKLAMWYKLPLSAGTAATVNFSEKVNWYRIYDYHIYFEKDDVSLCEIPAVLWSDEHFFAVYYMPEGGNANVKLERPVTPEKGTGTKDDPFVLDDALDKLLGGGGTGGTGGGGTGGTGTGTGVDGTGSGSYPNPPVIITPPAGTSSHYSYTAKDDCVLGLVVNVGNEFEGRLTINGADAGKIEDREMILHKGDVVMLNIANAGKDDMVGINIRNLCEGDLWNMAIELKEGKNDILKVVENKNLPRWYKVTVPAKTPMAIDIDAKGKAYVFTDENVEKETLDAWFWTTSEGDGIAYNYNNASSTPLTFYVKLIAAEKDCSATVSFDPTAIDILSSEQGNAPAYNLQGLRVGSDYKGIVIINGKKVLKK